jgi:selenocysteine lyase/cysteine desulfurase
MNFAMSSDQASGRFDAILQNVRRRFPQIDKDIHGNKRIYLNCGAGTLMVDTAARAAAEASTLVHSLPGEVYPAEMTTREFHWRIREIAADFLNAPSAAEINFHFSTSQALISLALAMRGLIRARNNVVVTDLDHMANVSPWESVAGKWWGAEVRRARILESGRLDGEHLLSLVDEKTALVAITMASNGVGTIVALEALIPEIKNRSPRCLVCLDAVHHAMHGPIDVRSLDCDFLAFSGYKVFGPMLGVLWGKQSVLERLAPFKVETNKNEIPYKFEQGTLNNAALASLGAALRYLVWLADELEPDRTSESNRLKLKRAMTEISDYEKQISRTVLEGFQTFDQERFCCYGITNPDHIAERDPTFAFEIAGRSAAEIKHDLWGRRGIQIADGNHYSAAFYRHFRKDSVCRASFAHYNSLEEAGIFLAALEESMKDLS